MILAYDPSNNPLNTNEWAFPLCEVLHIGAFAFSIGTIALVDLRMFGFGLTRRSAAQLVRETDLSTMGGLAMVIMSGLAIFSSDPYHYMSNGPFQFKMAALLVAILYNYTIHRRVAMRTEGGAGATAAAAVSVALWFSLVWAGIFIAFV
jgi:hypothetical protein